LGYLQKIENILRGQHNKHPCFWLSDYFDLIGGTRTGSIIAASSDEKLSWRAGGTLPEKVKGFTSVSRVLVSTAIVNSRIGGFPIQIHLPQAIVKRNRKNFRWFKNSFFLIHCHKINWCPARSKKQKACCKTLTNEQAAFLKNPFQTKTRNHETTTVASPLCLSDEPGSGACPDS
jgi:hypothetical protein